MTTMINVGLDRVDGEANGVAKTLRALDAAGLSVTSHTVRHSATEYTVVASVERTPRFERSVDEAARALGQECIAAWDESTGVGELIGPHAGKWGTFSPEYFLLEDGRSLHEHAQASAHRLEGLLGRANDPAQALVADPGVSRLLTAWRQA